MHKAKAVFASTSHEIWNKENLEERRRGSETVAHLHSSQKRETIGITNARRNTDIFIPRNPGFTNRAPRSRKIDNNLKPDYTSSSSLRNKTSTQNKTVEMTS
jgi:hypothetical protein